MELRERLRTCLAPVSAQPCAARALTLHALGLSIVSRVEGRRPLVLQAGTGAGARLLDEVLAALLASDTTFLDHWLLYCLFSGECVRHPAEFSNRRQWQSFVRAQGVIRGRQAGFLTRRGELLPTQFEQAVADWLDLHGVPYQYRRLGLAGVAVRNALPRHRSPLAGRRGFHLPALRMWIICLAGSPREAAPAGVLAGFLFLELRQFQSAQAFGRLRHWLQARTGMMLPKAAVVLSRLGQPLTADQRRFLLRFLSLARLSGRDPQAMRHAGMCGRDPGRTALHLPLLERLCTAWSQALERRHAIDFEGMLHTAADHLLQGRYQAHWQLVLVDEFQDTSAAGLRLLQALLRANPACRLFAVGDDWQSIYRFAGAMPDVIARFARYFGPPATVCLSRTFRFDQSLADAASTFIRQNPSQLPKPVRARPPHGQAAVVLAHHWGAAQAEASLLACLEELERSAPPACASVFLLGRYQHQRPAGLSRWQRDFPRLKLGFHTIHAVKGLEADQVILLGLHGGLHGFPCEIQSDALLDPVLPAAEAFAHAEERRLFYVALTRSRGRVYLLADATRPSVFVDELQALAGRGALALRRLPLNPSQM